ncbi:hypothetical protein Y032_0124g1218 [Ancylostoma ceylanicum]|uniref:FAD/NAD(P)-binding domain-containing protein n=1 Tax=Ancylostoma ceylanicum TaxID=53326 RepID=A0A016T948_9BILA|nr:hypothetical protein Y032_0124g1218 [Ancylostoma ceylanicum]
MQEFSAPTYLTNNTNMKLSLPVQGQHFRLLIVGGGASGMGASHKFARKLPKKSVALVEPNEVGRQLFSD